MLAWLGALIRLILVGLFVIELDRWGPRLSERLLDAAAWLLPKGDRGYFLGSWLLVVVETGDRGVLPLVRALPIALIAAPLLGIGLRIGRQRHITRDENAR